MLGWNVRVHRLARRRSSPGSVRSATAGRIAVWQCGPFSLGWIDDLVTAGRAVDLGGDGYPNRYTAQARDVLPVVLAGPPGAVEPWASGPHDVLGPGWDGRTVLDREAAQRCHDDEWLLIEAWDES